MKQQSKLQPRTMSARAYGILQESDFMLDGLSNEKFAARFQESIGTIQKATSELQDLGYFKNTVTHYPGGYMSVTELTEAGRAFIRRRNSRPRASDPKWGY